MANGSRLHFYGYLLSRYNSLIPFRAKVVNNGRNLTVNPIVNYSTSVQSEPVELEIKKPVEEERINKAVQSYLQRSKAFETFLKEQTEAFEKGKAFLAKIMGKNSDSFKQEEIDEAIRYLFPSALHEPLARPMFKHPSLLYAKRKELQFDTTGRPHHYLFYTTKPNFSQALHDCAVNLQNLNDKLQKMGPSVVLPKVPINTAGTEWLNKKQMEAKLTERILDTEYERFIEAMNRLLAHPYSYEAAAFLMDFRCSKPELSVTFKKPKILTTEENIKFVEVKGCRRKKCKGSVKVFKPGTGKIRINGKSLIDFFEDVWPRQELKERALV